MKYTMISTIDGQITFRLGADSFMYYESDTNYITTSVYWMDSRNNQLRLNKLFKNIIKTNTSSKKALKKFNAAVIAHIIGKRLIPKAIKI